MEHAATGTAVVLFTDVVDSTGVRTRVGDDAAYAVLESHRRMVNDAIEAHHGSIVEDAAVGVKATFATASDAIAAAVALCREAAARDEPDGVEVRVGLSAGDVAFRHGDCHGSPAVEAARLCEAAGPNTILVSDVVRVLAGSRGAPELEEHGPLAVKGRQQPLEAFDVLWRPTPAPRPGHPDSDDAAAVPGGDDLDAVLAATGSPGLAVPVVLDCVASVAEALDDLAAHEPPQVHGDLEPGKVIRTAQGAFVLADFAASSASGDTPGQRMPGYAAPEVVRGDVGTPAADVYSLTAMAVALLTGGAPNGAPPRWSGLVDREAEAVSAVVQEGLNPDPAKRPRTAGELAARLRHAFESSVPVGDAAVLVSVSWGAEADAWDRLPDATADVLTRFSRAIEAAVVASGGRRIATSGQGRAELFVFDSIAGAVSMSADLQRLASDLDRPGVGLRAKAGMHVGALAISDGLVSGAAVAKVGRLSAAANPGETAISPAASEAIAAASVPLPREGAFQVSGNGDLRSSKADPHIRSKRRRAMVGIVAVVVLAAAMAGAWAYDRSRRQGEASPALRAASLAADAVRLRSDKPSVAALAAVEAGQAHAEIEDESLQEATAEDVRSALLSTVVTPVRRELAGHEGHGIVALAVSQPQLPSGTTPGRHEILASLDDAGHLRLWDLRFGTSTPTPAGEVDLSPSEDAQADALTLAPDGRFAAVRTSRGVEVVATAEAESLRPVAMLEGAVAPPAFGPAPMDLAIDRSGRMWDLACAAGPSDCGSLTPVWAASAVGIQFATVRPNSPDGSSAVVSVDTISGPTVTRYEVAMAKGGAGWVGTHLREASFTDDRCATAECRLLGTGDVILLDIGTASGTHVLSLGQFASGGFLRAAAEVEVPYEPIGLFANARGSVARPTSGSFVLMGADDDLYTLTADLESGIGPVESRKEYRAGGSVGVVDATATFVVGGDDEGTVNLNEIAPGQAFVNDGLPDSEPAVPVEGTDVILRRVGQVTGDCCDVRASNHDAEMALGQTRPATVRGVTCPSGRYLAVPRVASVDVYRFPEPAVASFAIPGPAQGATNVDPVSIACSGDAPGVVLASPGAGLKRFTFTEAGPQQVDVIDPATCCAGVGNEVTLTGDGRFLLVADPAAAGKPPGTPELAIWDVEDGTWLDVSALGALPRGGPPVVAPQGDASAVIVARGTSVERIEVDPETHTVGVDHVADIQAPAVSVAVAPDTDEAVVGTSSTVELVSLSSGNRLGLPLMFSGIARFDSGGGLWVHVTGIGNAFGYASTPLDNEALSARGCELAGGEPDPDDWEDVVDHDGSDVCAGL